MARGPIFSSFEIGMKRVISFEIRLDLFRWLISSKGSRSTRYNLAIPFRVSPFLARWVLNWNFSRGCRASKFFVKRPFLAKGILISYSGFLGGVTPL